MTIEVKVYREMKIVEEYDVDLVEAVEDYIEQLNGTRAAEAPDLPKGYFIETFMK